MAKLRTLVLAAAVLLLALVPAKAGLLQIQASPNNVPTVEYDASKLPAPVRDLRQKLMDIARNGDIEKLRDVMKPNRPDLGYATGDDPVEFLRSQSGDDEGREILAILLEVLEAGYVHTDVGTTEEAYVWPYFARYPIERLNGKQMVELFKLITAGDFDDMKNYGAYIFYRATIKPDGTWESFIAGD